MAELNPSYPSDPLQLTRNRVVPRSPASYRRAMQRLVSVIQELSLARELPAVMAIVRAAARELTGADGATFILRDGALCHYVDEDAIAPLWKGSRFPMTACISGWAMLNRQSVAIADIYADPRIPADAYRPTFVKSLAMVPIRTAAPIGAIGAYWAVTHHADAEEIEILQALADSASMAIDNVELYRSLERRVADRTAKLQALNEELDAFAYSVSHDLRAPLRRIDGFASLLMTDHAGQLDAGGQHYLARIRAGSADMDALITGLLTLSGAVRGELNKQSVDLSEIARAVIDRLRHDEPARQVTSSVEDGVRDIGDPRLLHSVLENLLGNAWKFSRGTNPAHLAFGRTVVDDTACYFVSDNGAGFDAAHAHTRLFGAFQRLHSAEEFAGTGIGLATVRRIVNRHGGRIWARSQPGEGAIFYFTLGALDEAV
mgnify:CR=1 FL=1